MFPMRLKETSNSGLSTKGKKPPPSNTALMVQPGPEFNPPTYTIPVILEVDKYLLTINIK